ncbi:ROK family protein [Ewingella americana]
MLTPLQRRILGAIAASDGLSRTDLVQLSGMSKAAVSGVVREMIDAGFLFEAESVPGTGQGRPSVRLLVQPDGAYFAGVSLLQDPAHMVLINLHGEILSRVSFPLSNVPQQLADEIASALPALLEHHADAAEKLLGLGVTLSGFIDEHQSTCVQSALLGWRDVPLANLISQTTGMDVAIENDAKALAVSEKRFGHARELNSFTLVSHGAGIGSAHFIAGHLYRGAHGGAGEIAHSTIELNGTPCRCGKRGCLDTIASLNAVMQAAKAEGLNVSTMAQIEALASKGNNQAVRILHHAGTALGLAVSHLIQINDPEMILIAHQEGAFSGLFGTVVQQSIDANVLPGVAGLTSVRTFSLNDDTWARAAASIAAHRFLVGLNSTVR